MWCQNCGQDVPRVALPGSGELCCLRCGKPTLPRAPDAGDRAVVDAGKEDAAPNDLGTATSPRLPIAPYDGWELEEQIRHAGRLLGATAASEASTPPTATTKPARVFRIDGAHASLQTSHGPTRPRRPRRWGTRILDASLWLAVLAGLTSSSCGGVLLAWSLIARRTDLWNVGMPVALGGLAALGLVAVVGSLLRLDRLGSKTQRTEARLAQVGDQLHRLQAATSSLGAAHHPAGSPSGALYDHLAEGASAQLLLADLKSQLDLLARKIVNT